MKKPRRARGGDEGERNYAQLRSVSRSVCALELLEGNTYTKISTYNSLKELKKRKCKFLCDFIPVIVMTVENLQKGQTRCLAYEARRYLAIFGMYFKEGEEESCSYPFIAF